jgi:uncharacterized protein
VVTPVAWRRTGEPPGYSLAALAAAGERLVGDGWEVVAGERETWAVHFSFETNDAWLTRSAVIEVTDVTGTRRMSLRADRRHRWTVDRMRRPDLDGCLDIDVAATPFTNTLPIRRLGLEPGAHAEIRVAWVGVPGLEVEVAAQRYTRLATAGDVDRYEFRALPAGRRYLLTVDEQGLVIEYEGLWTRVAT